MTSHVARSPRVFISYSHDSPEHKDCVLELSDRLLNDGINCVLDQYEVAPLGGFPLWADREIRDADFVLMICTSTYYRRVMREEEIGTGLGVSWESNAIYQYIYNAAASNERFIPILLEGAVISDIPIPLQGVPYYSPITDTGYEALYRRLTGQPLTPKPKIGKLRKLLPRERKHNVDENKTKNDMESGIKENKHASIKNIPYEQNPFFTGRKQILQDLHERLNKDGATALVQSQAISGLGGIGKTQTALEYTYHYHNEYTVIFWVNASTEITLRTDFTEFAKLLDLPVQEAQNPDDIVTATKKWLEGKNKWLIIFDNADRPELLKAYYPRNTKGKGHILLTSRAQVFDILGLAKPLEMMEMLPEEAIEFIFKRTGRDDKDSEEKIAASQLAAELGYLPLALEQSCSYIIAKKVRFQDYLTSYYKRHLALLNKSMPRVTDYPQSVTTTWAINFNEIEKEPGASDLLHISAFLSPDSIPLELIIDGASQLGPTLSQILANANDDPVVVSELLEPLMRYSLIRLDIDEQAYSIHRLVQEVIKDTMDAQTRLMWAERTVQAVSLAFPSNASHAISWSKCQRCLPHIQVSATLIEKMKIKSIEAVNLLKRTGQYLRIRAQYNEATPFLTKALSITEEISKPEDSIITEVLHELAWLYHDQGQFSQAEATHVRVLTIQEKTFGTEHPLVASCLIDLAEIFLHQYRDSEAEQLLTRANAILENSQEVNTTTLYKAFHTFGRLYDEQGKEKQAEEFYKKALALGEKLFPEDIHDLLHNLAWLYHQQGQFSQAEDLYQRSLTMSEQAEGSNHPSHANTLDYLARLYHAQGKNEQAEALFQRALDVYEKTVEPSHFKMRTCQRSLATYYRYEGKYTQAEALLKQILVKEERIFGTEHPETAATLSELAWLYHDQGKYSQAEIALVRALKNTEATPNPDLDGLSRILYLLGDIYKHLRKNVLAEALLLRRLTIPNKPFLEETYYKLIEIYEVQGQYSKAEPLYRKIISLHSQRLDSDDLSIIEIRKRHAALLLKMRQRRNKRKR